MAEIGCVVPEEWWVDYHLGRLSPERRARLEHHRAVCPVCAEASRRWSAWLGRVREGKDVPDVKDARPMAPEMDGTHPSGVRGAVSWFPQPFAQVSAAGTVRSSPGVPGPRLVWKRWWMRAAVRFYSWRRRTARALRAGSRRGRLAVAGGAFAALLLAGLIRSAFPHEPAIDPVTSRAEEYVQRHEPMAARFISLPDTVQYPLGPDSLQGGLGLPPVAGGALWVNGRTGELFVLLEGLLPSDSRDVQAWGVIRQKRLNLGVLQFHQRQAHLYVRHAWTNGWEAVAFTIEPKGGSPQPTAPETAIVRLEADPKVPVADQPKRP